ncbi:MAG: phage holin family protein [Symbiobacteriaceae bacterium]|nr:phage holin family protein [Symbiobacteriaceae bacterium]
MIEVQRVWETVIAILLASCGGLARLLHTKNRKKMLWSLILSELFISGFAGLMVLMLARASGITGDWLGVICGMSGWIGPRILDILIQPAGKVLDIDLMAKEKA